MDESKFDDLTRFMAERPSRRKVLGAMAAAISGSLASFGTALGAPRCKRVNQACQTTADCCPGPNANGNVYCKQVSKNAKVCATCPSGTPTACNGGCINTSSDNNNCGACGKVCHGGTTCVNGSCQCPAGQHLCADGSCHECCSDSHCDLLDICCGGSCTSFYGDAANCGGCGNVCRADQVCDRGNCSCPTGQVEDANGACVCSTTCFSGQPCCNGYYCNFGACLTCEPTGGDCENSGDPGHPMDQACCSGTCNPATLTCA